MKFKHRLMSALLTLFVGLGCFAVMPSVAEAQYYGGGYNSPNQYRRPRFGFRHRFHAYLGGQLNAFVIASQVTDAAGYMGHGGGGGLFLGLRMGPFFSAELNWGINFHDETFGNASGFSETYIDNLYLMTVMVDGKIHIPTRGPVEPYFQAGIGYAYLGATYDDVYCSRGRFCETSFAQGPAFNLGGGIDFWLGPFFTLGGRLLYRGILFSEGVGIDGTRSDDSNFINGVAIDINGTFHF